MTGLFIKPQRGSFGPILERSNGMWTDPSPQPGHTHSSTTTMRSSFVPGHDRRGGPFHPAQGVFKVFQTKDPLAEREMKQRDPRYTL